MDTAEDCADNGEVSTKEDINDEDWEGSFQDPVPGYETFDLYLQEAFDAVKSGIKAANNLPIGDNYKYYTCFPSFNNVKKTEIQRLINVMQHVLGAAGTNSKIMHRDIDEKFDVLIEANDLLLDRANVCMDEESGVTGNLNPDIERQIKKRVTNGSWNAQTSSPINQQKANSKLINLDVKNIDKPQQFFKDKIDNSSQPWCPRLKDKPNSLKPLALDLLENEDGEYFAHPYEFELERFSPSESQLKKRTPMSYKALDDTPLVIIDKPSDIKTLLDDLKKYKEIAVDLEHHSYRSFQGITCLMQLSTPDTDYIIDTLSLRTELHELNEVFTDPKILKVFHSAEFDIIWLQKDLSLYVVNMFDTYQAAVQLSMPYLSLAYLLRRYCDVNPNKMFQLADWRVRPLSDELLKYAREDVHYLLHIKDHLQNQLLEMGNGQSNILEAVYQRSTEVCKKVYVKPVFTEKSYLSMYRKSKKMFNNKQLYALQELYKWRDTTARENDDSINYVLPNHMLLSIAETLPREMQGILACCNPIPPLVRQHLLCLHKIVLKAREQPLIKAQLSEDLRQRLAQRNHASDSEFSSYCPHDTPGGAELRPGLPCLLDTIFEENNVLSDAPIKHIVTIFDSPAASEDEEDADDRAVSNRKMFTFISPFERYKKVIPMVAQHEEEERQRQHREEEERLNKIKQKEEELNESKSRVHEHFKNVAHLAEKDSESKIKKEKPAKLPLCKMEGRKRKRNSSVSKEDDSQNNTRDNLSTPVPVLNKKILPGMKRKVEDEDDVVNTTSQSRNDTVKPFRKRIKNEKKETEKELARKGMLPAKNFDYKAVDFSSFQGGSKNAPNQVHFKPDARRKKKKQRGKKTNTKISI